MIHKPDIRDFKHIAIIQTAFLGDVALALPLAEKIKSLSGSAELTFVTTPQSAPFVECARNIDNVLVYDKRDKHKGRFPIYVV